MPPASKSSPAALAKRLKELTALSDPPSSVLIIAPDEIRRGRALKLLLSAFLSKEETKHGIERIDCAGLSKSGLQNALSGLTSTSLFSTKRFLLIQRIDQLKVELMDLLYPALKSPVPGTHLFLLGEKLPVNSKLLKQFRERELAFVLEELKGVEFERWIEKELKQAGIERYEIELVQSIKSFAEIGAELSSIPSPDLAFMAIERLALFVDGESAGTADFERIFPESALVNEYELVEALNRRDRGIIEVLQRKLENKEVNPFMLLGLLWRTYSSYLSIASLKTNGRSDQEIPNLLSVNSWLYNKYLSGVRGQSLGKLRYKCAEILRCDGRLKSNALDNDNTLSSLFSSLAS